MVSAPRRWSTAQRDARASMVFGFARDGGGGGGARSAANGEDDALARASRANAPVRETEEAQDASDDGGDVDDGCLLDARGTLTPSTTTVVGRTTRENVKVMVRIRPPLRRELNGDVAYQKAMVRARDGGAVVASENIERALGHVGARAFERDASDEELDYSKFKTQEFGFDEVYDETATQEEVYAKSAKPAVLNALDGYNATVLAYGQTGTGKTYTMEGDRGTMLAYGQQRFGLPGNAPVTDGSQRGIIPRAIEDIFNFIAADSHARSKYLVRVSYLQIYNETVSDLLKPERTNLQIREDKKRGVFVEGQSEWVVRTPTEIYGLLERGAQLRATGSTKMNEISSRSHAVFTIIIEHSVIEDDDPVDGGDATTSSPRAERQSITVGKLNLVDLAGSERVSLTGATGKRLDESKKINQSLSALGNVISALTDTKTRPHIPYRDSKLTRILEDSLGGNCITTVIANVSPALEAFTESVSTLKFASRAKEIKNSAKLNEDLDQKSLLRKYERELRQLRTELGERTKNLVDKRRLLEVDEQRRKAEADKLQALTELERRSREFLIEKQAKKDLEARIAAMQSQLLGSDDPSSIARVRAEYEEKLKSIEAERHEAADSTRQVERYKAVLLKQRDIMLGLTARLRERDERIAELQLEITASDEQRSALEDALDTKTAELLALKRAAVQETLSSRDLSGKLKSALGGWGDEAGDSRRSSVSDGKAAEVELELDALRTKVRALESTNHEQRDVLQDVEAENARLRLEMVAVERRNDSSVRCEQLEAKCASYERERAAIRTIIGSKISSLATKIADTVETLPRDVRDDAERGGRILRLSQVLERLLDATLVALDKDDEAKT